MSSNAAAIQRRLTRDETGTLFGQTMGFVALLFAFGFLIGAGGAPSVAYCARSDPGRAAGPRRGSCRRRA
jgi:hypothetical protein